MKFGIPEDRFNHLHTVAEEVLGALHRRNKGLLSHRKLTRDNIYSQGYCGWFSKDFTEKVPGTKTLRSCCGDHWYTITEDGIIVDETALQYSRFVPDPIPEVLALPLYCPRILIAKAGIQTRLAIKKMGCDIGLLKCDHRYIWDHTRATIENSS